MNKKKLVVLMLVLVMVLSLSVTALVGCNKENDDIDGFNQTSAITLDEALGSALWNAAEDNKLNALKASAQLTLTANESVYAIKLNANLALKNDSTEYNSFGLSFVDAKANANILNVYYNEGYSKQPGYGDAYKDYDKMLFVDLGSGTDAKHFSINALSVKETLKDQKVDIDDQYLEDHEIDDTTITSGIAGILNYFDLVKGMADKFDKKGNLKSSALYQSDDGQTLLLRLRLDRILANAKDLLGAIDPFTELLTLDLNSKNLGSILPDLTIDLIFKMSGVEGNNFDGAKLEGFEAKLNVPKKDMRIQRTSTAGGGDFIRINIDKDCKFGIGLDFNFGADAKNYNIAPLGFTSTQNLYVNTNAINAAAEGQLTLNEEIGFSFKLNEGTDKEENIKIGIPTGTYNLKFAVDADPVRLIGESFDFKNNLMGSIKTILGAVDYLKIEIKNTDDSKKANLMVRLIREDRDGSGVKLWAYLDDLNLIGDLANSFQFKAAPIDDVLDIIEPMFAPKKDDTTTTTADEEIDEATRELLGEIAKIVKSMTVKVNCDGNILDIDVKDHLVAAHTGKADTTISAKATVSKAEGIKLDVALKNMLIDGIECGNLDASLVAKDGAVTITAKAPNLKLDSGKVPLQIDIVIKLTKVSYGNAQTAFAA